MGTPAGVRAGGATVLLVVALAATPRPGGAYADAVHRLVNGRATTALPEPLRGLFTANSAFLRAHAVDPDLWKASDPEEGPRHYFELDGFEEIVAGRVPASERQHLQRHGPGAVERGRLPWRIAELHAELVAAFRRRELEQILDRAAVLGHYVADAHVPLHAVANHDGQLTGQDGLHARWEIHLFARYAHQIAPRVAPGAAAPLSDPVLVAFTALRESFTRAPEVLQADRRTAGKRDLLETAGDDRYGDDYYSALFEMEAEHLAARLGTAAEKVAGLWLSAWEKAGRPQLDWSQRVPHVRGQTRLVVAVLEGAGADLVDQAGARGALPHLEALRREGSHGRVRPPFPARAAATQASLWTGAWPRLHGVVGDGATRPSGTVLETTDGLRSTALGSEPLWATAARQGVPTVVVGVPQAVPFAPFLSQKRFGSDLGRHLILLSTDDAGIEAAVLRAEDVSPAPSPAWADAPPGSSARSVTIPVGGTTVPGLLFDDPEDPAPGFDTLALSSRRDLSSAALLKPTLPGRGDPASVAVGLPTSRGRALVHFRLFALSGDGREVLLWHSAAARTEASREAVATAADAEEGWVRDGTHRLYSEGRFGPRLWEGGDGTAESRYLETVRVAVHQSVRLASLALERTDWGLIVLSLPFPAEVLDLWGGYLDPERAGHDAALAIRLRPFLDDALRLADTWVGEIARRTPADSGLAVVGDRGLAGVDRVARPNVALEAAGLLSTLDDGSIDLARTKVVYSPANGGLLVVNGDSRPEGIQPRKGEPIVRAASIGVAREMSDPVTGDAVIAELLVPDDRGAPPGIGGPSGGFLYLRPAPGVVLSPATRGPAVGPVETRGDSFDPAPPSAAGVLVLAGRGLARGRNLGETAIVDLAPTFARVLGIEPPQGAIGETIERALAPDPAPAEGRRTDDSR